MAKIYPSGDASIPFNITKRINVPVGSVVRVMLTGTPDGHHWLLEEETTNGETCGERLVWHPVDGSCCCQAGPSVGATSYDLAVPGTYRLFAAKCDGTDVLQIDLDSVLIVTREILDPNGVFAAKILSEADMACCPQQVTVTEIPTGIIITIDGVPTVIPTNGSAVTITQVDPTTLIFTVDGVPTTLDLPAAFIADPSALSQLATAMAPYLAGAVAVEALAPLMGDGTTGNPLGIDYSALSGDLISGDAGNIIETGSDGLLFAPCVSWLCAPLAP